MTMKDSYTLRAAKNSPRARERISPKIGNLGTQSQQGSPALSYDNKYKPMTEKARITPRNQPILDIWGYHDSKFSDYGLLGCDALWAGTNVSKELPSSIFRAQDYQTTRRHIPEEFLK